MPRPCSRCPRVADGRRARREDRAARRLRLSERVQEYGRVEPAAVCDEDRPEAWSSASALSIRSRRRRSAIGAARFARSGRRDGDGFCVGPLRRCRCGARARRDGTAIGAPVQRCRPSRRSLSRSNSTNRRPCRSCPSPSGRNPSGNRRCGSDGSAPSAAGSRLAPSGSSCTRSRTCDVRRCLAA